MNTSEEAFLGGQDNERQDDVSRVSTIHLCLLCGGILLYCALLVYLLYAKERRRRLTVLLAANFCIIVVLQDVAVSVSKVNESGTLNGTSSLEGKVISCTIESFGKVTLNGIIGTICIMIYLAVKRPFWFHTKQANLRFKAAVVGMSWLYGIVVTSLMLFLQVVAADEILFPVSGSCRVSDNVPLLAVWAFFCRSPPLVTGTFSLIKALKSSASVNVFSSNPVDRIRLQNVALAKKMMAVVIVSVIVLLVQITNVFISQQRPATSRGGRLVYDVLLFILPLPVLLYPIIKHIHGLYSRVRATVDVSVIPTQP